MTADLPARILAAIEETRQIAWEEAEFGNHPSGDWWGEGSWWLEGTEMLVVGKGDAGSDIVAYTYLESTRAHIARHDPARVLARCAADRKLVEAYQYLVADPELRMHAWTFALRALAAGYGIESEEA